MLNYYDMLGVTQTATPAEIKSAYKRISIGLHPDTVGNNVTSHLFDELTRGKETLLTPSLRKEYDKKLDCAESQKKKQPLGEYRLQEGSLLYDSYVSQVRNMMSKLMDSHDRFTKQSLQPVKTGIIEVDAIDLVHGVVAQKIELGGGRDIVVDLDPLTKPGGTAVVRDDSGAHEVTVCLHPASLTHGLYYKGSVFLILAVDTESLLYGGTMQTDILSEAQKLGVSSINILPSSYPICEVSVAEGLRVLLVDEQLVNDSLAK